MTPPLNGIRAFVAAGRTGNFTTAARVLNVTQGAISQQVARLEDYLGVRLFERARSGLSFTTEGRRLFLAVRDASEQIDQAVASARAMRGRDRLVITTIGSLASQWLIPRLPNFRRSHPDLHLVLETTLETLDLEAGQADAAIRFGAGQWPNTTSRLLFGDVMFPVAAPRYAATLDLARGAPALAGVPLFYDLDDVTEWGRWFAAADADEIEPRLVYGFSDALVMLNALLASPPDTAGVAIIRAGLVERELAEGRLERLFDIAIDAPGAFYFVEPTRTIANPVLAAFGDWLIAEAQRYGSK